MRALVSIWVALALSCDPVDRPYLLKLDGGGQAGGDGIVKGEVKDSQAEGRLNVSCPPGQVFVEILRNEFGSPTCGYEPCGALPGCLGQPTCNPQISGFHCSAMLQCAGERTLHYELRCGTPALPDAAADAAPPDAAPDGPAWTGCVVFGGERLCSCSNQTPPLMPNDSDDRYVGTCSSVWGCCYMDFAGTSCTCPEDTTLCENNIAAGRMRVASCPP